MKVARKALVLGECAYDIHDGAQVF